MGKIEYPRSVKVDLNPFKCQRVAETENDDDDDADRISSLGDPLLSHILSFLTTKQAMKTSVLSKRWKYVWMDAPVLDFYDTLEVTKKKTDQFASFVNRALRMNKVSHLKKFSFCNLLGFDLVHINAWITKLFERYIEEVELYLGHFHCAHYQVLFQLLQMFVTRVQAVELKMAAGLIKGFPILADQFLHLKILRLWYISFHCSASINRLIASCPVLEELYITQCRWHNILIESSTLKYLALDFGDSDISGLVVIAPLLQQIYYACFGRHYCGSYSPMQCMMRAEISSFDVPLALLDAIIGTKTLHLVCSDINENVKRAIRTNQLCFNYLTCLKLSVRDGGLQFLPGMLNCSPNLVSLVYSKPYACSWERLNYVHPECIKWIPPPDVPECLLSCLETVEIKLPLFEDCRCDDCLGMMGYFIENGAALKQMKLSFYGVDAEEDINFLKELFLLPSASTTFQLTLVCKERGDKSISCFADTNNQ